MKLYRADKRDFNVGDVISTASEFISKNPDGSMAIEEMFEAVRPKNKPIRSGHLYLFEDITVAKKHWSKMTDGKLYEVDVDVKSILHRADMRLVDKAFSSETDPEKQDCAINYWSGIETEDPRIEILVLNATVTGILSKDQNERIQYLRSWAFT